MIQRFGSALNMNVHLHMLVLDGVFVAAYGKQRFREVAAPDSQTLQALLERIIARLLKSLERDGLFIRDLEQPWLDLETRDALDSFGAASIQYRIALGANAGQKALFAETRGARQCGANQAFHRGARWFFTECGGGVQSPSARAH